MPGLLHVARDAPAAFFYLSGAVVGTAAGLVESAIPEPSAYVPRVLKSVWDFRTGHRRRISPAAEALPGAESGELDQAGPDNEAAAPHMTLLPIIVCGKSGSKTHLLSWWATGRFPAACKATVGADLFLTDVRLDQHKMVSVQLWDTGGELQMQRLGPAFFSRAGAVLFFADLHDESALPALDHLLWTRSDGPGQPAKPAIVLGILKHTAIPRQVTTEAAEDWCAVRGVVYTEMASPDDLSALTVAVESLVRTTML